MKHVAFGSKRRVTRSNQTEDITRGINPSEWYYGLTYGKIFFVRRDKLPLLKFEVTVARVTGPKANGTRFGGVIVSVRIIP